MTVLKDFSGLGHLEAPRNYVMSRAGEPSSSMKIVKRFLALSVDLDYKQMDVLTIPADAWVLFALVGVAIYLHCRVTEED